MNPQQRILIPLQHRKHSIPNPTTRLKHNLLPRIPLTTPLQHWKLAHQPFPVFEEILAIVAVKHVPKVGGSFEETFAVFGREFVLVLEGNLFESEGEVVGVGGYLVPGIVVEDFGGVGEVAGAEDGGTLDYGVAAICRGWRGSGGGGELEGGGG